MILRVHSLVLDSCCFYPVSNTRARNLFRSRTRMKCIFDYANCVTSLPVLSVSDIRLSGTQLHAGAMAQRSFPHHSAHIKLISSNDICPIGSISYSCPPEERWWRRGRVNLKWPSMKLILILLQSVQMKLVCDTKCFEQIMAVQCINIFSATAGFTLRCNSELKEISNPFYPQQSLGNSYR